MKKRLLASLLSATILLSMTPMAFADEEPVGEDLTTPTTQADEGSEVVPGENQEVLTGSCGENATWTLDGDTLTISGTGATADWKDHGSADDGMHCGAEAHDGDTTCEKANCMLNRPWQSYIDSITKIVIEEGITAIGSDSFNGLTAVTEIELPDSLTEIGIGAFCFTAITEVTIPANVSTMGYSAFYGCGKLESVFFAGNKVREIGIYTFAKCYALKNLEFPEGLTAIRLGALQECRSLEELVFPESLTVLEQSVLGDFLWERNAKYHTEKGRGKE
jgi:hypothetical protein